MIGGAFLKDLVRGFLIAAGVVEKAFLISNLQLMHPALLWRATSAMCRQVVRKLVILELFGEMKVIKTRIKSSWFTF